MDYQLFLTSGMREAYVHGANARLAVAQGLQAGKPVVIAAALIMIAVFGGFIFSGLFGMSGVTGFNIWSMLVSVIGAIIVLWIYEKLIAKS